MFNELVRASQAVAETNSRRTKIAMLAEFLGRLSPSDIEIAVGFLIGEPRQGRLGVGWASLGRVVEASSPTGTPALTLAEIDQVFEQLGSLSGKGSATSRSA